MDVTYERLLQMIGQLYVEATLKGDTVNALKQALQEAQKPKSGAA